MNIVDSIKQDLLSMPESTFISKKIFEPVPYIFKGNWDDYFSWKMDLSQKFNIDPSEIFITGSAALGVSLNPYKNFKLFDANSDIDISVVAPHYFEVAWHDLLYLNVERINEQMRVAIDDHRTRLIYWGTIATDKILPLLSFGMKWEKIIKDYKQTKYFQNHEIHFRIYKDMTAVRKYLSLSVSQCKAKLLGE